jgi:SAM-dependent methyltransferase
VSLSDHARANRSAWGAMAADYECAGRRHWADNEIAWGMWEIPEAQLGSLPEVDGGDVIELGCGTAYVSSWLARRGARPVGIDPTTGFAGGARPEQLATARSLQAEHGLDFPLIEGSAEAVPLPDDSFDLAISEYGASLWCDPEAWIPEAARLLRPGVIALLRRCGFTVEALHELQAPEGATSRHTYVTPEWARRWPSEEIWVARLAGGQERSSPVA